ncbi:MAG: Cell division protein YlmG/Ycf19 (putative), YggT family [Brockia lithotrophica]|uniref:Cell division protein YlmG/Ycf19 (Putative), YggT family n=1 Tax=Brockia lithotrophica TaxID=933949 RepID=A0A2T5G6G6_9BACL|nr:YggT family protein [Brockia lithotrophica]MBT9252924.1 YggT family protein [Brockia lithotrophica]PTQ51765.1 MAG: Cell division protein YlmG/Ycf19 (putative), YggT family [Brockia lithotrophica]
MIREYILLFTSWAIDLYFYAMILYILSSWIPPLYNTRFVRFLAEISEPYLGFFRRIIPPIGILDISPILALFVYKFLAMLLLRGLYTVLYAW